MYLEYEVYQNMGGTLDETTFNSFEYEAETTVNWYTFNRLKDEAPEDYPEELAKCMYRLIELAKLKADLLLASQRTEVTESSTSGDFPAIVYADVPDGSHTSTTTNTTAPPIRSQSNDGVSISYNTIDASDLYRRLTALGRNNPLEETVFRYLNGVRNSKGKKLTYRGLYPDE